MLKEGQVEYLAGLAKIAMSQEDITVMNRDMESIMELMNSIHDVDLPENMDSPQGVGIASLREDIPVERISPKKLARDEELGFSIPKLME